MKIIKIDGIGGLFTAAFIGICLFAGFVVFPGFVAMHLWNKYLVALLAFPKLNIFQGILLWGIIFQCCNIITKGEIPVSFQTPKDLSDAELNMIMKNARIHSQMRRRNAIIQKTDRFEKNISQNPFNAVNKDLSVESPSNSTSDDDESKVSNLK